MTLIFMILLIVASILSTVCFVIVLIGMAQDWGILMAVVSFLLCQILVFFYGWFYWESEIKNLVMSVWTLCILLSFGVVFGTMQME